MRIRTKRYWYFVTQDFMGHTTTLKPRIPLCAAPDEPNIKRICVAPTAAHCMSAIYLFPSSPVYVYRTLRRVHATKAWDVGDSEITREHFLLRKSKFEFVSVISPCWIEKFHRKGAFENRGAPECEYSYRYQGYQKQLLVRGLVKFDRRLGLLSESDTRFSYKGEDKLMGDKWPHSNYIHCRDGELELLGIKPRTNLCEKMVDCNNDVKMMAP